MKKQKKIIIGIPAFNAEKNISNILQALSRQTIEINKIIVFSDGSKDKTVKKCYELKKKLKNLQVIDANVRKGLVHAVKEMIKHFNSDLFILVNDDIKITDDNLIKKLIKPFEVQSNVGLVSGKPVPILTKNEIQKACISTYKIYDSIRYSINNGNNKFTCDGKLLVLSKKFIDNLKLPSNNKHVGNLDTYLYFSCLATKFQYKHVKEAIVYFVYPDNLKDYIEWTSRNNANRFLLKNKFGNIVDKEYKKPLLLYIRSSMKQMFENPLGLSFIYCIGLLGKFKSKGIAKNFNPIWNSITSTKIDLKN